MADALSEAAEKLLAKNVLDRFTRYVAIQQEILSSGKSLMEADSYDAAYERFRVLVKHAENLWDDACALFERGSFATALALTITCLEEIGKISVSRFQLIVDEHLRRQGLAPQQAAANLKKGNPFYSHKQKMLIAAGAGALINSRIDRVLGLNYVVDFLERTERGEIEILRQNALYTDANDGAIHIPSQRITRENALFYVALAGECLAEVGGLEPDEWGRLLERVQSFEKSTGHEHE